MLRLRKVADWMTLALWRSHFLVWLRTVAWGSLKNREWEITCGLLTVTQSWSARWRIVIQNFRCTASLEATGTPTRLKRLNVGVADSGWARGTCPCTSNLFIKAKDRQSVRYLDVVKISFTRQILQTTWGQCMVFPSWSVMLINAQQSLYPGEASHGTKKALIAEVIIWEMVNISYPSGLLFWSWFWPWFRFKCKLVFFKINVLLENIIFILGSSQIHGAVHLFNEIHMFVALLFFCACVCLFFFFWNCVIQ